MNFRNIDTRSLTPEQLANAELMAEFTRSHECKQAFNLVNAAEHIIPGLASHQSPASAFKMAMQYAKEIHALGEAYMQGTFDEWKAARPTEPAPAPDEITDIDEDDAPEITTTDAAPASALGAVVPAETITRDAAVADTEARTAAGETVTPFAETLPAVDPAAVVNAEKQADQVEAAAAGVEPTGH